jgi:N-acetylglutamate synthase-like GNAT family acetyltransferase
MAFDATNISKPIGFLLSHELSDDCVELQSLWVDKRYRNRGIAKRLIVNVTQKKNKKYIIGLVQSFLSLELIKLGFRKVDASFIPLRVLFRYVMRKSFIEIFNFIKKSESALYIKL